MFALALDFFEPHPNQGRLLVSCPLVVLLPTKCLPLREEIVNPQVMIIHDDNANGQILNRVGA